MAKTTSAKKAERVAKRRRVINLRRKKDMKDALKNMMKLVGSKDAKQISAALPMFQKAVDKAAKGGVIKGNTAARMKSNVAKRVAALA